MQEVKKVNPRDKSPEELLVMDEMEFRSRMRERCHHTLEIQLYECAASLRQLNPDQTKTVDKFLDVWDKRQLSHELPEYKFAKRLRDMADELNSTGHVDLSPYAPDELSSSDISAFEKVIYQRRTIRHWDWERKVPDEVIDNILNAGLWAAHACNLQSIRYIVVREEDAPGMFQGSDVPGGPVHLVILQDLRAYKANPMMPAHNKLLDCGAAGQNIVLAAHAYGLGAVWLTFTPRMGALREKLGISDDYDLVTYVDVGYPAQTPCAPDRLSLDETVLKRI